MKEIKNSSNIHSVDHSDGKLTVKFHSGAIWDYHDVPEALHTEMMKIHDEGGSVGSFFHHRIKSVFKATKREES